MKLNWHGADGGDYRAWAPALYPDDPFPPGYLIVKVGRASRRVIKMLRGAPGHREVEHVGSADNLAKAKARAEEHYAGRAVTR